MRLPGFLHTAEFRAGVASAILLAVASPPSPLGWVGLVSLTPLLAVMFSPARQREGTPLRVRTLAFSFGITLHLIRTHWLVLLGEASPLTFKWALPFMLVLLALYLTVGDWILVSVLARIRRHQGAQAIWWTPALWVLVEWARGLGDMGFPWLGLGTTQLRTLPFLQLAGVLGELGVTLFVVWVNVLVVLVWQTWRGEFPGLGRATLSRLWAPAGLVLLLVLTWWYGVSTLRSLEPGPDDPGLTVGVVQANVDLADKWDRAKRDSTFVPYTRLTRQVTDQDARLVIWAETAVPVSLDLPGAEPYVEYLRDLVRSREAYLYFGYPEHVVGDGDRLDSYNSSILMDDAGLIRDRYRKMQLLAFGERMPFQEALPFLGRIDFGQAEWQPGPEHTVFEVDGHRFAALICYESIFSRLGRRGVQRGAGFLVNITNDGWFGDTILPHQHAQMAVMRAVENRVPLLRCANNGISFAVDPGGRVAPRTGLFEREAFVTTIHPRPGGSFYTRHGDTTVFLLLGVGGLFLLLVSWTTRRSVS